MKKDKKWAAKNLCHTLPSREDVANYERAHEELLEGVKDGIPSVQWYKQFYEKNKLSEVIPKVRGWIGICETCFALLKSEHIDIKKLTTEKCEKVKPNQECYLLGKRCRDVILKGTRCRNLSEKTWKGVGDPVSERWHFLNDYIFQLSVRKDKRYCSIKCRKEAQNKQSYFTSKLKGISP